MKKSLKRKQKKAKAKLMKKLSKEVTPGEFNSYANDGTFMEKVLQK